MEESISLNELYAVIGALREREYRQNKFSAAIKGINLDEETGNTAQGAFAAAEEKANEILTGMNSEERTLSELGFGVEVEDE
jgi:hypothetical protein